MNHPNCGNLASPEGCRPKYKHPRDTFHAFMVEGAEFDPEYDMPLLRDDRFVPTALVPFSVAKRADWTNFDCAVHFCERDQDIEPFWNNPGRYIPKLMKFRGVIGLRLLVDALEPSMIISYGQNSYGVLDYPIGLGIPVHAYASRGRGDLGGGALGVKVL